jgi:hypothetical protein
MPNFGTDDGFCLCGYREPHGRGDLGCHDTEYRAFRTAAKDALANMHRDGVKRGLHLALNLVEMELQDSGGGGGGGVLVRLKRELTTLMKASS